MTGSILNFIKIFHTAFSLPTVFAGAWLGNTGRFPSLWILLLVIAAATGARTFGFSFNRIFDRHIDAQNPRTASRELPRGALSVQAALAVTTAGLVMYLASCAALGGWCLVLAPIPLVPLLFYSLLKRFTPLCHFGIGLCLALAPLGAFVATAGHIRFSLPVILFAVYVFFWMSGADILYAILDIESDRQNGIHSLPAFYGRAAAMRMAACCHITATALIAGVLFVIGGGVGSFIALGLSTLFLGAAHVTVIPVELRFFPISTMAGVAAAFVPILGS
ncbi:MAG: putative 4-hydroxybenzoate polyprenyltransferase [bacterium]|nr:putative 4-hydroxybenzoate polyprenyltransferase [bacterium]MDT8396271.1 UbiA-like polyprenyltransferase [bacterium]